MANVKEVEKWELGIYQLETTDPVMGGEDGIDNLQAKQLANRTCYLKKQIENVSKSIPTVPVQSVNGKTGDIQLSAADVGTLTEQQLRERFLPAKLMPGKKPIYEVGELVNFKNRPFVNNSELILKNDYQNSTGFRRSPDGFIYQWGEISIVQSVDNVQFTVVFPVAFNEYCCFFNALYRIDACFVTEIQRTNTFFRGLLFERVMNDRIDEGKIVWMAFGR